MRGRVALLSLLSMLSLAVALVVAPGGATAAPVTKATSARTNAVTSSSLGKILADLYRASRHRLCLGRLRSAHGPVPRAVHGWPDRFVAWGGGRHD